MVHYIEFPFTEEILQVLKYHLSSDVGIQKLLSLTVASNLSGGNEKILSCAAKDQFKHGQASSICQ